MYADHIPKATSLLADIIAVLRPPGDEEESVGTTFCFLGGRMHVSGKAAAKDLDYSQGLNFILPSFLPFLPWKWKLSAKPACSRGIQVSIFRANGLGEKAGHSGYCRDMQLGTWLIEPVLLQGTDSGAVPVLHMESWPPGGACFGTTELHFVDTPSSY